MVKKVVFEDVGQCDRELITQYENYYIYFGVKMEVVFIFRASFCSLQQCP